MKHTARFLSVCLVLASLMIAPASCSSSKKAATASSVDKQEQQAAGAKKKKKISFWSWFGKKQKTYVFSCYEGETLRYIYSYDGLIWKYLNDAQGAPVTSIPEESIVKRTKVLNKYPDQVTGTLDEGSDPQIMKIGNYTYLYWNKAITKKIGCIRTKYSNLNSDKDVEDAASYVSFPKGIHLGELYEIGKNAVQL